jgi:hypothetical protein
MKRILLIVTMLLIATPAFATVTITGIWGIGADVNKLTVRYNCSAGEAVRAFALDFTLATMSPQPVWSGIQDFNRGESNRPGGGYGIFPGQFRNVINPADPNWFNQNYTPIAGPNEVDSNGTGLGTNKVICELGSLYKDIVNAPGTSGTLFTLAIDINTQIYIPLTVVTNAIRGGVVLENGTSITPTLSFPTPCFSCCPSAPAALTYPAADGNNGRYQVSWSAASGATGYKLQRSADGGTTWVTIYTGSATTFCDDVNTGAYKYQVASTVSGCSDSAYTTGAGTCAVVLCFPTSEPNMTTWKAIGKPRCWCYQRQCKGDGNGAVEGNSKSGYYWVGSNDLTMFTKAYLVKEPTFGVGLKGEPNVCMDMTHTQEGNSKSGYYRVGAADLGVFTKTYLVKEPTFGSGIGTCPAGASGSRFTLPADNKPCN